MPTGRELRRVAKLDGPAFEAAYVALLTTALEATHDFADAHDGSGADALAEAAVASCAQALEAL